MTPVAEANEVPGLAMAHTTRPEQAVEKQSWVPSPLPLKESINSPAPGPLLASFSTGCTVSSNTPLAENLSKPYALTDDPASIVYLRAEQDSAYSYTLPPWLNILPEH